MLLPFLLDELAEYFLCLDAASPHAATGAPSTNAPPVVPEGFTVSAHPATAFSSTPGATVVLLTSSLFFQALTYS